MTETTQGKLSAWFYIKDELGSFWEVDSFKDDFSEEEKTLKNGDF